MESTVEMIKQHPKNQEIRVDHRLTSFPMQHLSFASASKFFKTKKKVLWCRQHEMCRFGIVFALSPSWRSLWGVCDFIEERRSVFESGMARLSQMTLLLRCVDKIKDWIGWKKMFDDFIRRFFFDKLKCDQSWLNQIYSDKIFDSYFLFKLIIYYFI